jgi:hypothetical protein
MLRRYATITASKAQATNALTSLQNSFGIKTCMNCSWNTSQTLKNVNNSGIPSSLLSRETTVSDQTPTDTTALNTNSHRKNIVKIKHQIVLSRFALALLVVNAILIIAAVLVLI